MTGLPKAGKSLISWAMYKILVGRRSFFLERLAPDMEGQWTLETAGGQELARSLKNQVKKAGFFSPAFVNFKAQALLGLVKGGTFEVVIGDLGGLPSPENRAILQPTLEYARFSGEVGVYPVVLYRADLNQDPHSWIEWWVQEWGIYPITWPTRWSQVMGDIKEAALKEAASLLKRLGV